jgi:hypothetical protein
MIKQVGHFEIVVVAVVGAKSDIAALVDGNAALVAGNAVAAAVAAANKKRARPSV